MVEVGKSRVKTGSFAPSPADNVGMSTANLPNTAAFTHALNSTGRPNVIGRIGTWFRKAPEIARTSRPSAGSDAAPESVAGPLAVSDQTLFNGNQPEAHDPRSTFLRPRARRDGAVEALEKGLSTLADLMAGIRVGLEAQARRQEDLARCLAHLPELVQQFPESQRLQLEAQGALRQQMERQNAEHGQLANVLERIHQADIAQGRALDRMCRHEAAINQNLGQVSAVMQTVGFTSQASVRVLEQLGQNIDQHNGKLERAIKSQNMRLTALLGIAISLSAAAFGSFAVMGFLLIHRVH